MLVGGFAYSELFDYWYHLIPSFAESNLLVQVIETNASCRLFHGDEFLHAGLPLARSFTNHEEMWEDIRQSIAVDGHDIDEARETHRG